MKTLREALTKEYLKRLEEMAIRLKYRLSTDGYSGARRSMAKGSSLEFSDYREYAAGDDLRRVDWNGFARFGKLYLKLFLEEKQASVHVFLDCSRSMEQDGKFLAAKKLAASFAYVGLCGGDQVHLFVFSAPAEKTGGFSGQTGSSRGDCAFVRSHGMRPFAAGHCRCDF